MEEEDNEFVGLDALMREQTAQAEDLMEAEEAALQVIGFNLGQAHFVVDILHVREIMRFNELEITRVPYSHPYILGVVNLRGKVVPMIDLGQRLGGSSVEGGDRARAVVVELKQELLGFTVDSVSEVLRLQQDEIQPPASSEEYVVGVAMMNGQIMSLLDLKVLFAKGDYTALDQAE